MARAQGGAFHRKQARLAGHSNGMIARRVAAGAWVQLDHHVFAIAAVPATLERHLHAAVLLNPVAALSHTTSAAHLGLDGVRHGRTHITVPPTEHHRSALAVVHRSRHFDVTVVRGVRTTSFAQTMVQLAGMADERLLRSALHSGVHADPTRLEAVQTRLAVLRARRLPGLRSLSTLVDDLVGHPPTASELERLLLDVLGLVEGLPPVRRQHHAGWDGRRDAIFDVFVDDWNLVLEADGREWHSTNAAFERDRWRDAEAAANGLTVMRFTHRRLRDDPLGAAAQVSRFGARRAA